MKNYRVQGCKDILDKFEEGRMWTHIEKVDNSEAEYWEVYEVRENASEVWVASFVKFDEAELFALEKEKEVQG